MCHVRILIGPLRNKELFIYYSLGKKSIIYLRKVSRNCRQYIYIHILYTVLNPVDLTWHKKWIVKKITNRRIT